MSIAITIVPEGFAEAQRALQGVKNGFPNAAARAINRGLLAGRTATSKLVRARYNIKASDVKAKGLEIKRATQNHLGGALEIKGTMLPVSLFSPSGGGQTKRGKRKPVSVMIVRGARKVVKGGFMHADRRVLRRKGAERLPLDLVYTIGVPQMVGQLQISQEVEKTIATATATELKREVAYRLSKGTKL
jgi:hypothetical protein